MRLFIAIDFDTATTDKIVAVQDQLRRISKQGSFVCRERLHMTLVFLGEVDEERIPVIRSVMDEVPAKRLMLVFGRTGHFGQRRRRNKGEGNLWWIGAADSIVLSELRAGLFEALQMRGFTLESRAFSPHVTLARRVVIDEPTSDTKESQVSRDADKQLSFEPFTAAVDDIRLYSSSMVNGRQTYVELHRTVLG